MAYLRGWVAAQEASEKLVARLREFAADVEAVWGEEGLCRIEQAQEVPCCAILLPIQAQVRLTSASLHSLRCPWSLPCLCAPSRHAIL